MGRTSGEGAGFSQVSERLGVGVLAPGRSVMRWVGTFERMPFPPGGQGLRGYGLG